MADTVKLDVASRESVALTLTLDIAIQEKIYDDRSAYRKNLLDLYAECLQATSHQRTL